jgi:hypothetical protein
MIPGLGKAESDEGFSIFGRPETLRLSRCCHARIFFDGVDFYFISMTYDEMAGGNYALRSIVSIIRLTAAIKKFTPSKQAPRVVVVIVVALARSR